MIEVNTVMRHYKNDHVYQVHSLTNFTATNDQFEPTAVYYDINKPNELWSRPISEIEEKFTVLPHCTRLAKERLKLPVHSVLIPIYNIPQIDTLMDAYSELYGSMDSFLEEGLLNLIRDLQEVMNKPTAGLLGLIDTPFPFVLTFHSTWTDFTTFNSGEIRNIFNSLISENNHLIQRNNNITLSGSIKAV